MNTKELQEVLKLHKKWLNNKHADLRYVNLSGADLSGADLSGADLSGADLSGADLRYANLSSTNLHYANLSDANLSDANLSSANLSSANLSNANLRYTNLRGVKIHAIIGDSVFIRSMQLPKYLVNICDDWLQIGCQGHRVHEWVEFTDNQIASMDIGALKWWNEYRDLIFTFADWKEYIK